MFIFLIIFVMLAGDVGWWIWAARRPWMRARPRARWVLALWMIGIIFCFIDSMASRMLGSRSLTDWAPAVTILFVWHFLILPFCLLEMFGAGVIRGILWSIGRFTSRPAIKLSSDGPPAAPVNALDDASGVALSTSGPTRRDFLGALAVAVPPLLAVGISTRASWQLNDLRVRRFEIPIASLPLELDGLTLAHVSDIHVGRFTTKRSLHQIVEMTNNLKADLTLLTGDLINFELADLPAGLDAIRRLDPKFGLAMCEGNHDLFQGRDEFQTRVRAAGVPLLVDQTMSLNLRGRSVQLLGMQWGPGRGGGTRVMQSAMQNLQPQRDPDAFQILLAHHPAAFDIATEARIPLTLAGHTHGGQLMLNEDTGAGPLLFKYWSGLYRQDDAALVVSNGAGNWFPVRTHAPAELVHITLRAV